MKANQALGGVMIWNALSPYPPTRPDLPSSLTYHHPLPILPSACPIPSLHHLPTSGGHPQSIGVQIRLFAACSGHEPKHSHICNDHKGVYSGRITFCWPKFIVRIRSSWISASYLGLRLGKPSTRDSPSGEDKQVLSFSSKHCSGPPP